ncbi:TetR/AcrR family transcriptional regulator [Paenibacillus segetis]|uniref:TetR family transcriptional regulator n=1 Tax=Paenibacillus segetis TaxID=1325360 RepID=A0ABQ1YW00_9BACL|nr:TetR/AcrR family transcriptional regulator [Paenibacillus segetis]GGH39155.1 TetR family transcriptional regulator [Paenibacillus segetis]
MSPRAGLNADLILQAALEIADHQGISAVTLSSVAQKLGIRSPSLYNHVNGLDELRRRIATYALEQLYTRIVAATEGLSGEEGIRAFATSYINYAFEHPGLYEGAQITADQRDDEFSRASEALVHLAIQLLSDYSLSEQEALYAVRGLRSLIHGFASLERLGGFGLPFDLLDSFHFNLNVFLAGLGRG